MYDYDEGVLNADDIIFRTDIDLKPLFGESDVEQVSFQPTIKCTSDYPRPKSGALNKTSVNSGFCESDFKFEATVALDYGGGGAAAGGGGAAASS